MAERIYYRSRRYEVTGRFLRAGSRDIDLAPIESTHLRRPFLAGACAASVGVIGVLLAWHDVLTTTETVLMIAAPVLAIIIGMQIGILYLQSRLLGTMAGGTMWWHPQLRQVQRAIRRALADRSGDGGGNVRAA